MCESILSFFRVFYIHIHLNKRKMAPIQSKFAKSESEFVCNDGQRLPILKAGDGRPDCWTGEDEQLVHSDPVIDYPQQSTELEVDDEVDEVDDEVDEVKGTAVNGDNLFSPDKRASERKTLQLDLVPELVVENIHSGIVIKDYRVTYDETSHSLYLENTHHKLSAALSLDQLSHLMRTGGHSFRIVNRQSGLGGEGGGDCGGGVQQNGGLLDLPGEVVLFTLLSFVGIGAVVNEVNNYRTSGHSLSQYMSQRVRQLWKHTIAVGYNYLHSKISDGDSSNIKTEKEDGDKIKTEKEDENQIKTEKEDGSQIKIKTEKEDGDKIKTEKVETSNQTITVIF